MFGKKCSNHFNQAVKYKFLHGAITLTRNGHRSTKPKLLCRIFILRGGLVVVYFLYVFIIDGYIRLFCFPISLSKNIMTKWNLNWFSNYFNQSYN
jgi:hypothetical protein